MSPVLWPSVVAVEGKMGKERGGEKHEDGVTQASKISLRMKAFRLARQQEEGLRL